MSGHQKLQGDVRARKRFQNWLEEYPGVDPELRIAFELSRIADALELSEDCLTVGDSLQGIDHALDDIRCLAKEKFK